MSQPDLLTLLREATPPAPAELREHVRGLAAAAAPPSRRRRSWRLGLAAVALAALAAAALAATLFQPSSREGAPATPLHGNAASLKAATPAFTPSTAQAGAAALAPSPSSSASAGAAIATPALPPPSSSRAQRYGATLYLRLPSGSAVAAAARRADEIAQALGGYLQSTRILVSAAAGSANLVLRVPRARVGEAVADLSALGKLVGEQVSIADLQAGIDTTGQRIVRLERELAAAIHAPKSVASERLVAALTAQILGLQRSRETSRQSAQDATVTLHLATPTRKPVRRPARVSHHGPFHALGVAFRAAGIGAVYLLALGTPLALLALAAWLLGSRLRRRREEKLLSRS